MRERQSQRAASHGAAGAGLIMMVAVLTGIVFVSAGMVSLGTTNMIHSRLAHESYAALNLAELGLRRAMTIMQVMPRWATTGGVKTLTKDMEIEGFKGSYVITVTPTAETAPGGYPLVDVVATGTVGATSRGINARAHVYPPQFLRPALSIYDHTRGQGPLVTEGDVYVSGNLDQTGRLCVQGNLIADSVSLRGGGPANEVPLECRGRVHAVTGSTTTDLVANADAFRDRPINPAAWYRWAQRLVWVDVYGGQTPDTAALTFSRVLSDAASGDYPYGVMYFVNGDFTIPDSQPPGLGYQFRGQATIVVNGTLTIAAKSIQYATADSHLVLVSLGGVAVRPGGTGPFDALIYTYADDEAPSPASAGKVWKQTASGAHDLPAFAMRGTLAAGILERNGRLEINSGGNQLVTGAAPGVPGMQSVLDRWEIGLPQDVKLKRRWGIG